MIGRFLTRIGVTLLGFFLLWVSGLLLFTAALPHHAFRDDVATDAAVVLTGGPGRIDHGLALLKAEMVSQLFISGVNAVATPEEVFSQHTAALDPNLKTRIMLGREATSTIGNAEESARWIHQTRVRSVRLVTAHYHMPRSLLEFRAVLPADVTLYPDPVFPDPVDISRGWSDHRLRHLLLSEYHKTLAAMLRHLALWIETAA